MKQNRSLPSNLASAAASGKTEPAAEPSAVGEEVYEALHQFTVRARARRGLCDASAAERERLSRFLHFEARLLDERAYHEWLEQLTQDCVYWVPSGEELNDPRAEVAVSFDDRRRLLDRIVLHETGAQVAQIPASRTCRSVSNIEAWRDNGGFHVRSNLVVWEYRRQHVSTYAGRQDHALALIDGRVRIRFKIVHLINPAEPQGNNTFII